MNLPGLVDDRRRYGAGGGVLSSALARRAGSKAVIRVFATEALIFGIVNGLITAVMLRETESARKNPT
jgi:hypothetical protein